MISRKIINKLIDMYEKSRTYTGTNQVNQTFSIRPSVIFPKYNDDAEYELFKSVNEAATELNSRELVFTDFKRNGVLSKIQLNVDNLDKAYDFVKREPKRDEDTWLRQVLSKYAEVNNILGIYAREQLIRLEEGKKIHHYDGDKKAYVDILYLVNELISNDVEIYIRDFSIKLFADSKRVESLKAKATNILYNYGDYQDRDTIFEECGVVATPTYVCIKGRALIEINSQEIDLSLIKGDLALSTKTLEELQKVVVMGPRVVTIENITTFHDYNAADDFVIYLGGFHNRTKREFIRFLYNQNSDKEYLHFGDIDAGGFYIYEHLKNKTAIDFKPLYMDINTLNKYKKYVKSLTDNDKKRLKDILESESIILDSNVRSTIEYMLENNMKLEQESYFSDGGFTC